MPLFEISKTKLLPVEQENFALEKELQSLIEDNLEAVFNCRLVASEFTISTVEEFEEIKKYIELAYNKVGG